MTYAVSDFRGVFPEFDATAYPDTKVQFYLDLAYRQLNARVWGGLLDQAAALLTAHNLALAGSASAATRSGVGGLLATGLVSSKSLGGASVSYDTQAGTDPEAGAYNLTRYGQEFYTLLKSIVVGVAQV